MKSLDVILLVHNEYESIVSVVNNFLNLDYGDDILLAKIIVVEDGSTDGTSELIRSEFNSSEKIVLRQSNFKRGYVQAFLTGVKASSSELVFFSDTSNKYDQRDLISLLLHLGDNDLVIGNRKYFRDPIYRDLLRLFLNLIVSITFLTYSKDIDSPQRIYTRKLINRLVKSNITSKYLINLELTLMALKLRITICYVPISYEARKEGKSRGLPPKVIPRAVLDSLRIILRYLK